MKIKSVNCPLCEAENSFHASQTKVISCRSCGHGIDVTSGESTGWNGAGVNDLLDDLTLGMKGVIAGKEVEILGYILNSQSDDEGTYYWEEWFAVSEDEYFWIQYDYYDKTYTFFRQIDARLSVSPDALRVNTKLELNSDLPCRIDEVGVATVMMFAGEIPWKIAVGDQINFADGRWYSHRYSIEWSNNEIEVFEGRLVDRKEILRGFGQTEKLNELIRQENARIKWGMVKLVAYVVMFLALVGMVFAVSTGRKAYSQSFVICAPNRTPLLQKSTCTDTELPIGPIRLDQTGRVHVISLDSGSHSTSNWPYLEVELLNDAGIPVLAFAGDFWVDQGESNGTAQKAFVLREAGDYYIDAELTHSKPASQSDSYFTIRIEERVVLARYYLAVAGLCLFVIVGIKTYIK